MKTIGLIGGMSWESSKVYYELINRRVNELAGGSHSAKSLMVSVDFAEIEKMTFAGEWEAMGEMMAESAKQLQKGGADMILLCTNTIHLVSQYIENAVSIPFLHIAEPTGESAINMNAKKVALLGTRFTMEKDFYTKILENDFNLEVIIPPLEERQIVHDIIYNELVKGQFLDASKKNCQEIIKNLELQGAEAVILGCTELPILIAQSDVDIPTIETTKAHTYKAVDLALS